MKQCMYSKCFILVTCVNVVLTFQIVTHLGLTHLFIYIVINLSHRHAQTHRHMSAYQVCQPKYISKVYSNTTQPTPMYLDNLLAQFHVCVTTKRFVWSFFGSQSEFSTFDLSTWCLQKQIFLGMTRIVKISPLLHIPKSQCCYAVDFYVVYRHVICVYVCLLLCIYLLLCICLYATKIFQRNPKLKAQ